MTPVEIALLNSEWVEHVSLGGGVQRICPTCGAFKERGAKHEMNCAHDVGLIALGISTQKEREMFRERIARAARVTDPPAEGGC
jgi:hypothetical protein